MFLVNKLSKMEHNTKSGSRIAIVHKGSSLISDDAGQTVSLQCSDIHLCYAFSPLLKAAQDVRSGLHLHKSGGQATVDDNSEAV